MSEITSSGSEHRRADARRSRGAILAAAARLMDERPDASMGAIAGAAGVTRQTVYAHFPSREQLLDAVIDRITEQVAADMDAAGPDDGAAAGALLRVLDASARTADRYRGLARQMREQPSGAADDKERHAPIAERLGRVIRRGQESGEFDNAQPTDWLVAVVIALAHAAYEQVDAGQLAEQEAAPLLRTTVLRAVGGPTIE